MAFTSQELENIANSVIDYHFREQPTSQTIQDKPLLNAIRKNKKTFNGGKELITIAVKGEYDDTVQGYTHNDAVDHENPDDVKRASFTWKEIYKGITFTGTELKKAGITINNTKGTSTSTHSDNEMTQLVNLLEDKLESLKEGWERGLNKMFYLDGSQDAKEIPGIGAYILTDPTTNVSVAGINQSTYAWWRNRAQLGIVANSTNASDLPLRSVLKSELRQLRRYGGSPNLMLCGSDFLEQLENEFAVKGQTSQDGFSKDFDFGQGAIKFSNLTAVYDPTLDDLSMSKRAYLIDTKAFIYMPMEGEENRNHNPEREYNKFVYYRGVSTTAALVVNRRNSSGVYTIA